MAAPRFFLSHSHKDRPLVLPVDRVLKALGLNVWTDKFEMRSGGSLVRGIFNEGLQKSDYVCAFITQHSVKSKWVREELEFAFVRALSEGKPKIILLQFDKATIPVALRSRHYSSLQRHELGQIVREIAASANIPLMNPESDPTPYAANDYHDALREGDILYLLGSRRDELDFDPFFDPEGIKFKRRDLYVVRIDIGTNEIRSHHLSTARPTHTAMRVIDDKLLIFVNDKVANNAFEMDGRLFTLDAQTLRPRDVHSVFSEHNWGFNPVIDEQGRVQHKDFETTGNPVRIDDGAPEGETWQELAKRERSWRSDHCPFTVAYGPGRETGYLRFLDVPPSTFPTN